MDSGIVVPWSMNICMTSSWSAYPMSSAASEVREGIQLPSWQKVWMFSLLVM